MSCGQIAFERAGIPIEKYYASEIDKYAIQVTQKNYPDTIQLGSITDWQSWNIETPDIIIGGSPCQGFSFAGKQLNFEDERSKLFFTFVEILKHYKKINPKLLFLLENVVMKKEYNDAISSMLGELFPECIEQPELFRNGRLEPIQINSALVSAQNRKRLYWTNIQGIQQPKDKGILLKDIIENATADRDKSYCLDANYWKSCSKEYSDLKGRRQMVYGGVFRGRNIAEDKTEQKLEINNIEKSNALTSVSKDSVVIVKDDTYKREQDRLYYDKCCTLRSERYGIKVSQDNISWRKLTPLECERLQTVNTIYEIEVELCLDQIKNYVNAVEKSQKLQKLVLNVEKNALIEFAKLVVKNIQPSNLQIKHIAPQSVDILIQKIINKCTAINQKEKNIIVDFAEKKKMYNYQDIVEDFVIQNVFTNIIQEKIINTGKVELHLKYKNLCYQSSGKKPLKMYGKEIMQFVEIADMIFQKIEIEKCIFTTLYLLNMKNIDQMLIILYWYAKIVIDIFTQIEIQEKNILLNYSFENSYTNHVSNSQRYRMLGNGWTVDVISHIFKKIKNKL